MPRDVVLPMLGLFCFTFFLHLGVLYAWLDSFDVVHLVVLSVMNFLSMCRTRCRRHRRLHNALLYLVGRRLTGVPFDRSPESQNSRQLKPLFTSVLGGIKASSWE